MIESRPSPERSETTREAVRFDGDDSRFRTLFDHSAVGMCFVALDGTFVLANERMCEIVGFTSEELGAMTCIALTHPDDRAREARLTMQMKSGAFPSAALEKRYVRKNGSIVWCNLTLSLLADVHGDPLQFVGVVEDISERKHSADVILQNENLLRIAGRTARLGGWACDFSNGSITWSDEVCSILDVPFGTVPTLAEVYAFFTPGSLALLQTAVDHCCRTGESYDLELEVTTAADRHRWVRAIGQLDGSHERLVGAIQDITERKEAELEMVRMNRALKMLSGCSELVVRARDEMQLLDDICHLIVSNGGYSTAWIGYACDDERRTIEPVAATALAREYLASIKLSWDARIPEGCGPAGLAVRTGRISIVEDASTDPCFETWREPALDRGFRGVIALPLRDAAKTFGILTLYSPEIAAPPQAELELLQELADDVAFAIGHLRSQAEQRRVRDAVLTISAAVSMRSSTEFFERLAASMAGALDAQGAVIAKYDAARPDVARTIAAVIDGVRREAMEIPLLGTACGELLADATYVVTDRLGERFPTCSIAASTAAQAYVGKRLDDSSGNCLAFMFVFFRASLENEAFAVSTLEIFAARAAAELEREVADVRIVDQASWLDRARDAIVVRAIDGRVTFWNKSAERLYGWPSEIAIGANLGELLFEDLARMRDATAVVVTDGFWSGEVEHRRNDGSLVRVESRWTTMRDSDGNARSILSIETDITERKAAEREIENLAFYDPLTNLPNRLLFVKRMRTALDTCEGFGALLFIDLDNFKALNDTLGHDMGDLLLQHVARRLQGCVRSSDMVSRFGGDEFVIMSHVVGTSVAEATTHASRIAGDVLASFNAPFELDGNELNSTPSIGVTLFTRNDSTDELLKEADLAMYEAKAAGRNAVRFFDPRMQRLATARRALEDDIRVALKREEFSLVYQPQVDVTGNVIGAEALVRWDHGVRGAVPPCEFIPVAEESSLIVPLGRWIVRAACARLVAWSADPATASLKLSVNVSPREFRHADFVKSVLDAVAVTRADPRLLVLELTESVLVEDVDTVIAKMTALGEAGISFSLDDFGTGYSSLAYLKRMPLRQLKIDQSFVRDVLVDANDAVIARTIIALAGSLSLDVIAEGVETHAQREFLAAHGCRSFQGYLFSRPLAPEAFATFASAREPHARTATDADPVFK